MWRTAQIWWGGKEILVPASGWFPEEQVNSRNPIVSLVRVLLPSAAFTSHSTRLKNLTFCHTIKWIWRINWIRTVLCFSTENFKTKLKLGTFHGKDGALARAYLKKFKNLWKSSLNKLGIPFMKIIFSVSWLIKEGLWILYLIHPVRSIEELLETSQNIRVTVYQKFVGLHNCMFWQGTSHLRWSLIQNHID